MNRFNSLTLVCQQRIGEVAASRLALPKTQLITGYSHEAGREESAGETRRFGNLLSFTPAPPIFGASRGRNLSSETLLRCLWRFRPPPSRSHQLLRLVRLQHRGQESAGIVSFDGADFHVHKGMGLVPAIFDMPLLEKMKGTKSNRDFLDQMSRA